MTVPAGCPAAPEPPGSQGTTAMVGDVVSGGITIPLYCNLVPYGHWHHCVVAKRRAQLQWGREPDCPALMPLPFLPSAWPECEGHTDSSTTAALAGKRVRGQCPCLLPGPASSTHFNTPTFRWTDVWLSG